MKNRFSHAGYYLKEALTLLKLNKLSNGLSCLSIGLVLFLLSLVLCGWWTSQHMAETIKKEAEISVFFNRNLSAEALAHLQKSIQEIEGVGESRLVTAEESHTRMRSILGEEAKILELFAENPFNPYLEVRVHMDKIEPIVQGLKALPEVNSIRNNKDILERIQNLTDLVERFGLLIVAAVGISTLVLISHIIRQGMANQSDEINTLRLLGAPEYFLAIPFLLAGLFLTLGGGLLAVLLTGFVLTQAYEQISGTLTFLPLIPTQVLMRNMTFLVLPLSCILGLVGSILGLRASKQS